MRAIIDAFRRGGGEGKPLYLQAQLSFARDAAAALHEAWHQWRFAILPSPVLATLRMPADFDAAVAHVSPEALRETIRTSSDWRQHVAWLQEDAEMGFEEINLHNVGRTEQERFIDVFGEHVLPALKR